MTEAVNGRLTLLKRPSRNRNTYASKLYVMYYETLSSIDNGNRNVLRVVGKYYVII